MDRTIFGKFESSIVAGNDKKAIVYEHDGVYNVSFYVNGLFVYAVPQSFDSPIMAAQSALSFVAGMHFDVVLSEDKE